MRSASTYRGARRNAARAQGGGLLKWRVWGSYAETANETAKLNERATMALEARKHVSIAQVNAGVLAGPAVAAFAFLDFYRALPKRSRVVNRIINGLVKSLPTQRAA
jgi:hypothetical protein